MDTIAVGNSSATFMAAINEREARSREITNQLIEPGPESLQEKLEELQTFAVMRLTRLRELLTNPAAIHEARALLADQIGKFKLERVNENGRISFKANGNIDFFGEEVLTRGGWCRGPDLYIAVPGRNSRSKSQHERNKYLRSFGDQRCVRSLPPLPTRNRASSKRNPNRQCENQPPFELFIS